MHKSASISVRPRALVLFIAIIATLGTLALLPSQSSAEAINDSSPTIYVDDELVPGDWLYADAGTWWSSLDLPIDYTYEWLRCDEFGDDCSAAGGTDSDYQIQEGDAGYTIRVSVTGDDGDLSSTATSDYVGPIEGGANAGAIIDNENVQLGVMPQGMLNAPGGSPSAGEGVTKVGIRQMSTNLDGISPGSPQEGWGVADAANGIHGWGNVNGEEEGDGESLNLQTEFFDYVDEAAISVQNVVDGEGEPAMQVVHEFWPHETNDDVYEVSVSIEALRDIDDLRYRRVTDWDVEPTHFNEAITLIAGDSPFLIGASDQGFTSPDPLDEMDYVNFQGDMIKSPPSDAGAAFDFDFGALPEGEMRTFKLYYGVSETNTDALDAIADTGAEAYSMAENSDTYLTDGSPAVFFNAFSGIDGSAAPTNLSDPAPDTEITNVDRVSASEIVFDFTSDTPGATFECKLGTGMWMPCTSPHTINGGIAEGDNWFRVRAVFEGATDPAPASHVFTIDSVPPVIDWDGLPSEITTENWFEFEIVSSTDDPEDLNYTCILNGVPWTDDCDDDPYIENLDEGSYKLKVFATDGGGNDSNELVAEWYVEQGLPPETTIKTQITGPVSTQPLEMKFRSSEPQSTFMCSLDGAAWSDCTDPVMLSGMADGTHRFDVYAIDSFDNNDETPATIEFLVGAASVPPPPPPAPPKLSITKPKPDAEKLRLKVDCGTDDCTVTGVIRVGDQLFRLKGRKLEGGSKTIVLAIPRRAQRAIEAARERGRKARYTLYVRSANGTVSKRSGTF